MSIPSFFGNELSVKLWVEDLKAKIKLASLSDLNQTISNPPTQAEVQALSDGHDALLQALRDAELMEP